MATNTPDGTAVAPRAERVAEEHCYFNFLSPVLDVVFGFIGFKAPSATPAREAPQPLERVDRPPVEA